jgi:hypothetical protein
MLRRYARSRYFVPIALLLIFWQLLLVHVNVPWFGHHDANGIWISAVSRNFRTYGIDTLGPLPVLNRGSIPPENPIRYVRHPPLAPWLVTAAQLLFGEHEMSARMVSIFGTIIGTTAFYVLCRRLYDRQKALLCLVFFAFTPMLVYFGRMPNHEPLSLAFLLVFLAVFANWSRRPTRARWRLLLGTVVLAIWTAWATFFFTALLGVFGWLKGQQRRKMALLVMASGLSIVSVMAFYQSVYPDSLRVLYEGFVWRTSTLSEISQDFTWGEFVVQTAVHMLPHATLAVFVLGLAGIMPTLRHARGADQALLLTMALAGLAYITIFRSASYVHDYYKIYLMPFLAIAAANAVTLALSKPPIKRFAQPALIGMFVVSAAFAVLYVSRLYVASFADETLRFAQSIAEHTEPQEIVLSDLPQANPVIEYYAHRTILWNIQPPDAAARAAASEYPAVYAYCGPYDREVASAMHIESATVSEGGGCQFVRFGSE